MIGVVWRSGAADIIIAGAVVAALATIGTKVVRPTIRFFVRLETTMSFVEAELKPNGGGSLRDAIDKLVRRTENLEAVVHHPKEKP